MQPPGGMADLIRQDDVEKRTCSIDGCGEVAWARGWCRSHYSAWYDHGDPLVRLRRSPNPGAICEIPDCEKNTWARGWCAAHYSRWSRYGDPLGLAPKRAPRPRAPRPIRLCEFPGCDRKHALHGYCQSHWNQVKTGRPLQPLRSRKDARRLYSLDHTYFDEITDERRAYWLGFITADGCVRHDEGRDILAVSLKAGDSKHLQTLCNDLGSDRPVLFSQRNEVSVLFNSGHLVGSLERLGVTPRKSGVVQPWVGPPELMRHYWRGLFDGDGCIHKKRERQKWSLSIVGSKACVVGFARWAFDQCGSTAKPRDMGAYGSYWSWMVAGTWMPQDLARALYEGADVTLSRKLALANRLIGTGFGPRQGSLF